MTQKIRGTRAQHLRNEHIRGKYPRTFSPEPESPHMGTMSPGTMSPGTMSPRTVHKEHDSSQYNWMDSVGKYPRQRKNGTWTFSEFDDTTPPKYSWTVPAAGAATAAAAAAAAGTVYSRRQPHKSHHTNTRLVVSPMVSTSLTHGPQGHLVDMSSPTASTSASSGMGAGTGFGLLVGTFAAATLAARKKAKSRK